MIRVQVFTLNKNMYYSKRYINYPASFLLSRTNRETCMRKFQEMLVKQGTQPTVKRAAVLIPLYEKDNEVSLLYTRRAATLKSHRGQVSFPGGMVEKGDLSMEHTALRETEEELGISPDDIELWGKGNPILRQDMMILPIIGYIKKNVDLKHIYVNRKEVEEIFTVKIQDLVEPKYHRHTQFRGSYSAPVYLGGPYRIWGLTAVLTFMFLKSLLSPKDYTYQVKYIPDAITILRKKS